jgi:sialidase-1
MLSINNFIFMRVLTFFIFFSVSLQAQQAFVPVFTSGTEGHKTYRIPAIIKNKQGNLLAFAEGRVHGSGDFGDINIVLKISHDQGRHWSALQTIADYDSLQAGNPTPVLDDSDPRFPNGRIFLFYNTGNNHENEIREGKGLREVWYKTSTDGGISWSQAVNITSQVHRPNQPNRNPNYTYKEDWRHYANGPGHAMQFSQGPFQGRLLVAANHSEGPRGERGADYRAHAFYSDDHGDSFQIGASISIPGSNESTAAEISGGRLMMNIRNQRGDVRQRIIGVSEDAGTTWKNVSFDPQLPDPICEGSILLVGQKNKKNILAFSNAANEKRRDKLTLRISYDDGKTWPTYIPVAHASTEAEASRDFAAYSDLVKLSKNTIGILYEYKDYSQIVFSPIAWK